MKLRWPVPASRTRGTTTATVARPCGEGGGNPKGVPACGGTKSRRYTSDVVPKSAGSGPPRRAKRGARRGGGASKAHQPDRPRRGLSTTPPKVSWCGPGPGGPCGASRVFVSRKLAECSRWSHPAARPGSRRSPRESGTAEAVLLALRASARLELTKAHRSLTRPGGGTLLTYSMGRPDSPPPRWSWRRLRLR